MLSRGSVWVISVMTSTEVCLTQTASCTVYICLLLYRACYTVDALFTVLLLDVTFRRIESLLIDCLYILQVSVTVVTL